jgi:hypothetical protein
VRDVPPVDVIHAAPGVGLPKDIKLVRINVVIDLLLKSESNF